MVFDATARRLRNIKEILLVVSVVYFYTLASLLYFGRSTFGLDRAPVFIAVSTLFLIAIGLEGLLAWWHRRQFILWGIVLVASYGILGLYVAPILYGSGIYLYVLLEPLVMTFIGGFAFASGRLLAEQLVPDQVLTAKEIADDLKDLPGWKSDGDALTKSYRFADAEKALAFVERIGLIVNRSKHMPDIKTSDKVVALRLRSTDPEGITRKDIRLAREIDQI